ncbi:MAG: XRE family transcriptional regulator [Ignavibacteria bacterium GWA2_35_9]|nr:MAG: XRE family transcriptional regulator [Ignavibacteria bacterium GWA2_35_9]OGU43081.1 MAG: XRE family transcriptional regulator [Ignavibacteria bacterium GWB2_36_8]
MPDTNTMYNALLNKDSSFEGIFFVGVKTTGVFCRPTCTARKPKKENVDFFPSIKEALQYGYRPCKVCHPMQFNGETPGWLKNLMKDIEEKKIVKFKDADLRERNIDPARIRRWFKKHHGMTFQSYLRLLRVNTAFGRIKHGEKVIESAYDLGYESLSGFAESFKKTTGFSPSKSKDKRIVTVTRILTPLGPMLAGAVDEGICLLEFVDRRMIETQITRLKKYLNAEFVPGQNKHFNELDKQIKEYFEGKRKDFDLHLSIPGSEFQLKVWKELQRIPYGSTRSYQQQAIALGNPKAIRAVAKANGDNRIAIIIPCHRVIGKDGKLVGYGGGMWRKQFLLNLEKGNN